MAVACELFASFKRFIRTELQIIIRTVASRGAIQNMTWRTMASSVCAVDDMGFILDWSMR